MDKDDEISPVQEAADELSPEEEFRNRPSTLPDIGVDLSFFAMEEDAKTVGSAVNGWLQIFGKIMDLQRLSQVLVTFKYEEALATLDRGVKTAGVLTPTNDEIALGIAMTPAVLRNGEPKSVMILNAQYMIAFARVEMPDTEPIRKSMIYTLAHECGHVHDLEMQVRAFPNRILSTQLPYREVLLYGITSSCWEEYIASRLSAFMGDESTLTGYEDTFCSALKTAKPRADALIRQYRMHGDVGQIAREVSEIYRRLVTYASYMLGHVDGTTGNIEESVPNALKCLDEIPPFKPLFDRLVMELRKMYASYGEWQDLTIYDAMNDFAYELIKWAGLDIQAAGDQANIQIPFTDDTLPSIAEQLEFRMKTARVTATSAQ